MTKIYEISRFGGYWTMRVEIDHAVADPYMKETCEFWTGSKERLALNAGDYTKTFLQMLGRECYAHLASCNFGLPGVMSHFDGEEGWPLFDGTHGIKILDVDNSDLETEDFEIKELE